MNYNKDNMYQKGFTLIELIVVIGILSIIILIVSQPVANVIKYQRESQTTDNMRDNLQFVINKMEKELKTSSNVSSISNNVISFTDQFNAPMNYTYETGEIKRNGSNLTDNTIFTITAVNFIINSTNLVTINIKAKSLDGKDSVTMQTSVYPLNN